jgi:glycosyltransferase involved in cell wall biosynthesis/GT2 family glycosyltransferase
VIDVKSPDYTNTPASDRRPAYHYQPREAASPFVSIITPYYNTGPVFLETVRSITRMSFAHWEWLIVDDGSTDQESLAQLERVRASDPRIRVIHQANGGPAVARNRAVVEARGRYLHQVDGDDLMEPTYLEQAIWFLETQPQFAACGSYNVTFGSKNFLWPNGFHEYEKSIQDNRMVQQCVIRRSDFLACGGYDESISYEHADWDLWLNLAEAGLWGYTLPEYLTWYRTQERSLVVEIEQDTVRAQRFRSWLWNKHAGLAERFPHPVWESSRDHPHAEVRQDIPIQNPLAKPAGTKRVLFLVPWLEMGGVDKFNLDVIRTLSRRGYEFTVVATSRAQNAWLSEFTALTPDVFCLPEFLSYADHPRFLDYLIESRQIDAVLMSNSRLAYLLTPYLRARHPHLAMLDYNHMVMEDWLEGGYPRMAIRLGRLLDLNVANTEHLKQWMVAHGADPARLEVCHCNVDTQAWSPDACDRAAIRAELGVDAETPIILFAGRVIEQKRPLVFAQIIEQLAAHEPDFVALVAGDGDQLPALRDFVRQRRLDGRIRLLGATSLARMRELMAAADILLLPSRNEGLALVLYEALALEIVPVAADVGGQGELVTPECGYLIPPGPDELAGYVAALAALVREPARRQALAQQGRQRVVAQFDLERMADGMAAAISRAQQLAAEGPGAGAAEAAVRQSVHMAIEYTRMEEVADVLWNERYGHRVGRVAAGQIVRELREMALPIGSQRYEVYKGLRQGLRRAAHLARGTPRYIRTGKVLQIPAYIKGRATPRLLPPAPASAQPAAAENERERAPEAATPVARRSGE